MMHFQLTILLLLASTNFNQSCKVANWKPMTLGEQAEEANIVVYGRVTEHYPMRNFQTETAYTASMELFCVLKGENLPQIINVTEAGELTSCHHTRLPVGQAFIVLLQMDSSGVLTPDEVNYLSVAFEPNDSNIRQVVDAVGGDIGTKCPLWEGVSSGGVEGLLRFYRYLRAAVQIAVWFSAKITLMNTDT